MDEEFRRLIDFMAREMIELVVTQATDVDVEDGQRVSDVIRDTIDSVDLNKEVMACVRKHLVTN